jgi:PPOX class probable F420-dependent enzyme
MSPELEDTFRASVCMNVRSFRKDGTPVDTPTWVIPIDGHLCCYTDDRAYKVKRLRRNPKVEVAASDVWGMRSTPWFAGRCSIVEDEAQRQRVFDALRVKYGIHWKMSLWGSLLTGRVKHRVVLQFDLDEQSAPG